MFASLENIKLRALALRSSIHNEQQLTAVELSGMVAKKTNELIDVVNDLCDTVNQITGDLSFDYDAATETLRLKLTEVDDNE